MVNVKLDELKSIIIIECLDLLETNNVIHKNKAVNLLQKMANHYTVVLNNDKKTDLKLSLRKFILNEDGYNITLKRLYFALK